MRVITRQLAKEILFSSGFVLIALVALFAFFDLVGQLDDVADGRTIMQAFTLTAFTLPARIYEVMPLAALLASVYTMSRWAATSEFTCLRVAGTPPVTLGHYLHLRRVHRAGGLALCGRGEVHFEQSDHPNRPRIFLGRLGARRDDGRAAARTAENPLLDRDLDGGHRAPLQPADIRRLRQRHPRSKRQRQYHTHNA